ncbi:MAG TPA: hypothetical protein VIL58_00525 [Thermoplasmata archaeon]
MSTARVLLIVLGSAFFIAGAVVTTFDRILAIGCVAVGAFLIILPLIAIHDEG